MWPYPFLPQHTGADYSRQSHSEFRSTIGGPEFKYSRPAPQSSIDLLMIRGQPTRGPGRIGYRDEISDLPLAVQQGEPVVDEPLYHMFYPTKVNSGGLLHCRRPGTRSLNVCLDENSVLRSELDESTGRNAELKQGVNPIAAKFNSRVRREPRKISTSVAQDLVSIFDS